MAMEVSGSTGTQMTQLIYHVYHLQLYVSYYIPVYYMWQVVYSLGSSEKIYSTTCMIDKTFHGWSLYSTEIYKAKFNIKGLIYCIK